MKDTTCLFGIDIGGTSIKYGLFAGDGSLIEKWEQPTPAQKGFQKTIAWIAGELEICLARNGLDRASVSGIGLGVPGPVLPDGTINRCVNLGWDVVNPGDELGRYFTCPIQTCNDANAAALGEMWQGGGRGHRNLVFVTLGTGVGGGVIIDGRVLSGAHGAGGEIGHIPMQPEETQPCACGSFGCLEQYASAPGLEREARLAQAGYATAKEVMDAAKAGESAAEALVDNYAEQLGRAMAMIACVADPEVFVVGGGVSKAGEYLLGKIGAHFCRFAFHACRDTEIRQAELGNDAGIYGAAYLAQNEL